jgi:hypothetical protein
VEAVTIIRFGHGGEVTTTVFSRDGEKEAFIENGVIKSLSGKKTMAQVLDESMEYIDLIVSNPNSMISYKEVETGNQKGIEMNVFAHISENVRALKTIFRWVSDEEKRLELIKQAKYKLQLFTYEPDSVA